MGRADGSFQAQKIRSLSHHHCCWLMPPPHVLGREKLVVARVRSYFTQAGLLFLAGDVLAQTASWQLGSPTDPNIPQHPQADEEPGEMLHGEPGEMLHDPHRRGQGLVSEG